MKHLITHGLRNSGALPQHTAAGLAQLANLPKLEGITKVVVGTGLRFMEIYRSLVENGKLDASVPIAYSPFCGSVDGLDPPDTVVLANGTECKLGDYIGFGDTAAFDPWAFIGEQPDGTLFLAGGELMIALGAGKTPKAALFELNVETRDFGLICQG
jgi:hypothetical protein